MNKFEQLIEYVINDEQDKAQELFHEIVVEKSRDIYENIMAEEETVEEDVEEVSEDETVEEDVVEEGLEEELGGSQTQDFIDDIETEEEGISLEADDMEDEDMINVDMDAEDAGEEDLEDRVVDLEDKLDELMAEFEELMGDVDVDGDGDHDMDDHEAEETEEEEMEMETEGLEEAVSLEAAPKPVTSEQGDGKSGPVASNSGAKGMDAKPVSTDTNAESGRKAPQAKDMGGTTKPNMQAAPKPTTAQAGGVNAKSPIDG